MPIDVKKLIGEIAARNHCRVEDGDPIFAVSTVNRMMLEEAVEGLLERIRIAIVAFESSARVVEVHSGKVLAEEIRTSISAWKAAIAQDINIANVRSCEMIDKLNQAHSKPAMLRWGALGLAVGLLLLVGGILLGYYVR
jgi:capsular polysaccharide biosynthesis protein